MSTIERILSIAFAVASFIFVVIAGIRIWDVNIVEGVFFIALSLACAGACYDSVNIFRFFFLGRVDRVGSVKEMPRTGKRLFIASACLALPAMVAYLIKL